MLELIDYQTEKKLVEEVKLKENLNEAMRYLTAIRVIKGRPEVEKITKAASGDMTKYLDAQDEKKVGGKFMDRFKMAYGIDIRDNKQINDIKNMLTALENSYTPTEIKPFRVARNTDVALKGNDKFLDLYNKIPKQAEEALTLPAHDLLLAAGTTDHNQDLIEVPLFYMSIPKKDFDGAKRVFKVRGNSMEDLIPDGAWAICGDDIMPTFDEDFQGGKIYAVILNGIKYIIKYVRTGKKQGKNIVSIITESENKRYEPKEFRLSKVTHMYEYLGYARFKRQSE